MSHYLVYRGIGRTTIEDDLETCDPFGLAPAEVVELLLALGATPDLSMPTDDLWPTVGRVDEVMRQGSTYLVAMSRDAAEISVQERRIQAYDHTE